MTLPDFYMSKLIILGAGPTGMATALGLTNKDRSVELYEASNIVGGLGGSETFKGMVVMHKYHQYHLHYSIHNLLHIQEQILNNYNLV